MVSRRKLDKNEDGKGVDKTLQNSLEFNVCNFNISKYQDMSSGVIK